MIFENMKGSVGGNSTSTIVGVLLGLAFVAVAVTVLYTVLSPGNMPQFAILMDFSGGLTG